MALDQPALTELLGALRSGGNDLDFMREAMQLVLQALIDLEATQVIGAAATSAVTPAPPIAMAAELGCCRPRPATWELAVPKRRSGSFFPALLEPRRHIDRALWAVVMEAFVHGEHPQGPTIW